jgi:PAS domain S-box-containing protein
MTEHPEPQASILLVDDRPENLLALEAVLADLGRLVRAPSGEEALRHLLHQDFAVVLLDVQMEGLDGFETAQLIRGRDRSRHTPIIFVTAYEKNRLPVEQAYALGAVDYLVKPLVPKILRAKVEGFVELFRKTERVRQQAEQLRLLERQELEHRLAEQGLRRFQALIEHSWDAIVLADPDGTVRYASPSTARILGHAPEEFVGRAVFEFTHPDDAPAAKDLFARLMQRPDVSLTETFRCRHKDGSWRWVEGTATNLLAEPNVRAVVVNCHDVTGQRALQEALRQRVEELAEADRRKGEWIAMLGHELRNPLAPLAHAPPLLRAAGRDSRTAEHILGIMERQTRHIVRLVDDLLDVSRISRGRVRLRPERLDLSRLVRTAAEDRRPCLERAGLTLTVEVPETPLWATGDPARLSQVLNNFLDNAAKFTDPGGRVGVGLTGDGARTQAVLTVRDTGVGIEPDVLPQLFEPFCQADRSLDRTQGGLGLGLSLVKGLVEMHGGQVGAASGGPGQGAEFWVRLPLEQAGP